MSQDDFAIIAGIERYADPRVKPLGGAAEDARRFQAWVTAPGPGQVPEDHVFPLLDASYDEIKDVFIKLCLPAKESTYRGRRLYIYLAGHGVAQTPDEASLLATDGGPSAPDRHVPGYAWMNWFRLSAYFEEVVLFADCCRTKQGDWRVQPFPLDEIRSESARLVRWVRGFAAGYDDVAFERKDGQEKGGLFTKALLRALIHARQPDGRVTATSVREHLLNDPELLALSVQQPPPLIFERELVFTEGAPQFARVRFRAPASSEPLVEGGPGNQRRRARHEPPGWFSVELPRGIYAVKVPGRKPRFFEVEDVPGELDLDE